MKNKILVWLTVAMAASFAACGTASEGGSSGSSQETFQETVQDSTESDEQGSAQENGSTGVQENTQEGTQDDESGEPSQSQSENLSGTKGQILLEDFLERMENGEGEDLQTLAEGILTNPVCQFATGVFSVEEGFLPGFDNYEVEGFIEGVQFGPAMGSIPFVGYLFRLEEGADVDAFMQNLEDNCNQRWQMCVAADETVVEASGNTVFFVMCRNAEE